MRICRNPSTTIAPAAWSVDAPQDSVNANTWWEQFGDPVMHQLVESVLTGNLDVQAAVERVKQAQDLVTQNRSALLPELNAERHRLEHAAEHAAAARLCASGGCRTDGKLDA